MKKLTAILAALALVISLASCGNQNAGQTTSTTTTTSTDTTATTDTTASSDATASTDTDASSDASTDTDATTDTTTSSDTTASSDAEPETPDADVPDAELSAIIEKLYDGIGEDNMPAVADIPINADNFEYYFFIKPIDGATAVVSEALINAVAHSVGVIKLPDGADADAVAKEIEANANPRKWVCVEAEKVVVKAKGNLVLMAMTGADNADVIAANFDKLEA